MPASSRPYLDKALQNLRAAQLLLAEGLHDAAASRAYYAAYQAARAALLKVGREEDKHDRVQAAFAQELVRRRKVYPGKGAVLNELMTSRHAADYETQGIGS